VPLPIPPLPIDPEGMTPRPVPAPIEPLAAFEALNCKISI